MHRFWTARTPLARIGIVFISLVGIAIVLRLVQAATTTTFTRAPDGSLSLAVGKEAEEKPELDRADYDRRMRRLAHLPETATSTTSTPGLWPVTDAPYPLPGALLPFKRIVAYYGNFYSKGMGVLGEYPAEIVLAKLRAEAARWEAADPETPVIPAIHYIATTAQGEPGKEGKYLLRMPDDQIDRAIELAKEVDGIVFVDLQVGLSDIRAEIPMLEKYLAMPQVHLAIDPEFYMKGGQAPGRVVGTMSAADVNWAAQYLATLVQQHSLPPKILLIHRFTQGMLTGYRDIRPLPEVQMIVDMDGWGEPAKKKNTYSTIVAAEPVQFTGFKLFYKNDLRAPSTRLMTPEEVLALTPAPIYIQYQ